VNLRECVQYAALLISSAVRRIWLSVLRRPARIMSRTKLCWPIQSIHLCPWAQSQLSGTVFRLTLVTTEVCKAR
jgi:hypothetical protein